MIESVRLERLAIPLSDPYHLASVTVDELDAIVVEVRGTSGRFGFGEATTLPGYFDVSSDTVWNEASVIGSDLVGHDLEEGAAVSEEIPSRLTQSAFRTAIDTLSSKVSEPISAPIVGIVSASLDENEFVDEVQKQVATGVDVIKIKVGFDPEIDASRVSTASDHAPAGVTFRTDANQQFSLQGAQTFLDNADQDRLDLLEQPLPTGRLEDHAILRSETDVPIMLDEDVRDTDDIEAIVEEDAADAVKFKLMKQGGPEAVRTLAKRARQHGLSVVLGNGVQSDVGCVHEARLWNELELETAGEFNGWRKLERPILEETPTFEEGKLTWEGGSMQLGPLQKFRKETVTYRP